MLSRVFIAVFILLTVYGVATSHYGAAMLAAIAAVMYAWADRRISKFENAEQSSGTPPESES